MALLMFGGCKKLADPSEDSSGSDASTDETVSPPENIAGTYLTCGVTHSPTDAHPKGEVGCRLAHHESGKKIDLEAFADRWDWQYKEDTDAAVKVVGAPLKSPWHVLYQFEGTSRQQVEQAIDKTYISLPIQPKGSAAHVEMGAPISSIMERAYHHGDIDGDGYVDLLDRHPDGKTILYFYDPLATNKNFPYREEQYDKLNWTFANYFVLDYTADRKNQDYILARNHEGKFHYLLYERGKGITDGGPSPDFMKEFTHHVTGKFNSYSDTVLVRKVDDTLVHYYMGSKGSVVGGVWDDVYYLAGDFNKDGYDDLFTITIDGRGMYRTNITPKDSYDPMFAVPKPVAIVSGYTHFACGDFDGDGIDDLMGRTETGSLTLFKTVVNSGTPTWQIRENVATGWNFDDYFAADLNKNNKFEFIARSKDNSIKSFELP
jgi:hypothetical protein